MFSKFAGMTDTEVFKAVQQGAKRDNPTLSGEHLQHMAVIGTAIVLCDASPDRLAIATGLDRDFIADTLSRTIDNRRRAPRIFNVEAREDGER